MMPQRSMHFLPDFVRARTLSTDELRSAFLIQGLFRPDSITLRHVDLDRVVLGGVVPGREPLRLEPPESFKAQYFLERRELGVLNIGGRGFVTVDGERNDMDRLDVLYVALGSRVIEFGSEDPGTPARFYLVSYPAHTAQPTTLVRSDAVTGDPIGGAERANARRIARYIHLDGAPSAQLVMGVTRLEPGSVWNTMPSHTHFRRTEIYLYFDLPEDGLVVHLMGEPSETRHLIVRNEEVVLSPPWSIHSGCGTSNYTFCWAMGGENKDYADMQAIDTRELK